MESSFVDKLDHKDIVEYQRTHLPAVLCDLTAAFPEEIRTLVLDLIIMKYGDKSRDTPHVTTFKTKAKPQKPKKKPRQFSWSPVSLEISDIKVKDSFATLPPNNPSFDEVPASAVQKALLFKEEGNKLFKRGEYLLARGKYNDAIKFSTSLPPLDDESDQLREVETCCFSNLAATCLKLQDFENALTYCSTVYDRKPADVKNILRYAEALTAKNSYLDAINLLQRALTLHPNTKQSQSINSLMQRLQHLISLPGVMSHPL